MYVRSKSILTRVLALTLAMLMVLLGATGCAKPTSTGDTGDKGAAAGDVKPAGDAGGGSTESTGGTGTEDELTPEPGAKLKLWDSSDEGVERLGIGND